jgi:hypothetical protein
MQTIDIYQQMKPILASHNISEVDVSLAVSAILAVKDEDAMVCFFNDTPTLSNIKKSPRLSPYWVC